ncbi:MAG TPA: sugar phosphate nucleotidyltransferase [Candidatus Nanoarchaeia archaeon]|nr:sugar phosphate nucleotidyltransferase [Candidatus Nanoarchaeia archaeon]
MKAVILAGGFGTRLAAVLGDLPKPMISIAGKPFLEHQIRLLKEQGIKEIILTVHYRADKIKSYFGNGRRFGVNITYADEDVPLGTGGAIKNAAKYLDNTFLVLNGDSYSRIDINEFISFHNHKKSIATMAVKQTESDLHYGNVIMQENKIVSFSENNNTTGLINSGVYLFEPLIFDFIESNKFTSIEKEVFPILADRGMLWGYNYNGYFMDVAQPETYKKFKEDVMNTLFLPPTLTVREAFQKIGRSGINLIMIVDSDHKLLGVINERLIKEYLLAGGGLTDRLEQAMVKDPIVGKTTDDATKINMLLLSGINCLPIINELGIVKDVEFHVEKIKNESFPVIRGKAPLRISFAGGNTDLSYFFEKHGGAVISATINKYCYATLIKRADYKVIIDSDITQGPDVVMYSLDEIKYDGKFDLIKAIIKIMKPEFGFELYLHNDLAPGRGLGSSASMAVLIASMLNYLQNTKHDDYKIAEIAYKAEREELNIKGGWQDQYAAITGGFNFMEFEKERTIIYPLRLKEEVVNELSEHTTLCYVGGSHFSGDIHTRQEENFKENQEELVAPLHRLKNIAIEIKNALLRNELGKIGELLHESWENKRKLEKGISNPRIDQLYEVGRRNGAIGGRLLGAGGGGYILFFHSPKKRNQLQSSLKSEGGEIMDFNFEFAGTKIWTVNNSL